MSFTPILVLGIGVDDAFLLLHSWRWNKHQINVAKRMAIVITEIGPSISITSITNMLAFGVGTFSPSPMMSTFCCCTALAVALDFIYELAMFAPQFLLFLHDGRALSSNLFHESTQQGARATKAFHIGGDMRNSLCVATVE
uniref:Protein patched 1 n=1 Tax=Ascaris suum TaxID=6253 RepID=F1LBQ6_ASCSU